MMLAGESRRAGGNIRRRCVFMGDNQTEFVKGLQAKLDGKIRETEISVLEYWKEQIDKVLVLKPEGVAALQTHVKKISEMMGNRIKIMKRE